MKLKRTAADKWFSDCIRIAANWHCENCGGDYTNNLQGLDCSHFVGRANYSTRFIPMNAYAHCMGCHKKLGSNPLAFVEFVKKELGQLGLDMIKEMAQDTELGRAARKANKSGELSKHYRQEYRIMEKERVNGNMGPLVFKAWGFDLVASELTQRWALDHVS